MRPTPKQLAWAFFAYFAAISALGPGFHFWPVLGCHDHACHAIHTHEHSHAHTHGGHQHESTDEKHSGQGHEHSHKNSHERGHNHDDCLACQYYAQTQLPPADLPEESQAILFYPAPTLARQLPATALPAPYAPHGPPQA